ncbi:MAG: polysaccharide lyase family 8 super-sandwich domain-containing protein [Candidatus Pedobacter colombiensis]|uniref:Polysaccharide lyase family 8 super-sandwich domain-containing protein n=1 Tax=Candidatus Pedobacter colombiensis TaxID=3121371 RepID=A0AAJ6B4M6_9SPHI|nr:polysaccharide lyase family 8 super-sandwich domain-containing protein [Pedobacter sp.]WEK17777.1 MAG: polysaccharide lyase family 8 super-sandwich domain-containing protein [Pedobacter sp.]
MMKPIFLVVLFTLGLVFFNPAAAQSDPVYRIILQRVHQEQMDEVQDIRKLDKEVKDNLSGLNLENGKWESINYADHKRINPNWLPVLEKIRTMTLAYSSPKSSYYKDKKIWEAIDKSLKYFTGLKPLPYCDNWYQQGITRPQTLALSLVNMRFGELPLDSLVEKNTLAAICKDTAVTSNGRNNPMHKFNFGANRSQIAMGWIFIGALLENEKMVDVGVKEAYSPIQYTTGEGIQYDLSYDMHFGYLYNGGYGTEFMRCVIKSAAYTFGTKYALQGGQLDLFRKFILESIFGVIRGKWMDWNVVGRGISRVGAIAKDYSPYLEHLEKIDPQGKEQYSNIRKRMKGEVPVSFNVEPFHSHYWNTDYTVHARSSYFMSVHAVSNRKYSQEIGNLENMKGFWGAEGTMNLQLKGNEYYNIFPLWNWTKLPGTTLPDTLPVVKDKAPGVGDRRGTHPFSGGVSDARYGVTTYVMDNDLYTSAKKSWFMFDDEIVCLGTGIGSTLPYSVSTTLNQTILANDGLTLCTGGRISHYKKDLHLSFKDQLEWVWHDHVGYVFPQKGNVYLSAENRVGDWTGISMTGEDVNKKVEAKSVFQLNLQHGIRPENGKYAYILLPGIESPMKVKHYLEKKNISIESNTEKLQAVYHHRLKIWQVVFYEGNVQFDDGQIKVSTDIPSVLMLRKLENGKYQLYAADPSQLSKTLSVKIKIKGSDPQTINLDLPQKEYAGKTVSVVIN